jgi:hypothetical protein
MAGYAFDPICPGSQATEERQLLALAGRKAGVHHHQLIGYQRTSGGRGPRLFHRVNTMSIAAAPRCDPAPDLIGPITASRPSARLDGIPALLYGTRTRER